METQRTYLSIEHPSHCLPEDVAISISNLQEAELAELTCQDEITKLARPNREERRIIAEARESAAKASGISAESIQRRRDINVAKVNSLRELLDRQPVVIRPFPKLRRWNLDLKPVQPAPTDPTFWWAKTVRWTAGDISADSRDDGLHFSGGVTTHDGDLHKDSFGAVALFELQADRIPMSLSRRWVSTPHVELFGGLLGYTGDDDIFTGDLWAKCWMHRDQQIFQVGIGQDGPFPIVLGQAHESDTLIFEENGDRAVRAGLRGFQWMPPVTFSGINPANSLWARLEIRFDIQTEGAGTLLWLDPEVLLRTFQWPLTPL